MGRVKKLAVVFSISEEGGEHKHVHYVQMGSEDQGCSDLAVRGIRYDCCGCNWDVISSDFR